MELRSHRNSLSRGLSNPSKYYGWGGGGDILPRCTSIGSTKGIERDTEVTRAKMNA